MAGSLAPFLKQTWTTANGTPLSGGKLFSYQAGTTTPQATYTDSSLGTPNANPVILNASGQADVWLDPSLSYKFILQDSNGVQQWSVDNVIGLLTANAVNTASLQNLSVTTAKLALNSVDNTILKSDASVDGNRAVTTNHLRDGSVTLAKLNAALAVPTIQKFITGSGTYTTPAGVRWLRIRAVGGGGGGSGSGSAGGGAGGTGGNTTFGSSLIVANGGTGGVWATAAGTGGTASLGTGPIGVAFQGATGDGAGSSSSSGGLSGGSGGATPFGGAGAGGAAAGGVGNAAIANTGSGGGGGGGSTNVNSGFGGGAGGYVDAIIVSPSATYAYAVGAAGSAGSAGTSGNVGGAGAVGLILVEEHYI